MSEEINTRGMLRSKINGFPAGNEQQCMTKSEILATNIAIVNGRYLDNECPRIDDVQGHVIDYRWEFYTTPSTLLWRQNGDINEKSASVKCNFLTLINGVLTDTLKYNWSVKSFTNQNLWNVRKVGDYLYCSPRALDSSASTVTLQVEGKNVTTILFLQQEI